MITVANEMRQESEEKCSELEHKNTVQNNVINELKHELKQKNEYIHSQEDIQKLVEDVKSLQMSNQEKELEIENISIENHNLKVKLANMEIEKKEEKEEGIFLAKELGLELSPQFECRDCGKRFGNFSDLIRHKKKVHDVRNKILQMKLKLFETEKMISEQKLLLSKKIFQLKETESIERLTCKCVGWCGISHLKHSWKKSHSKELEAKFQLLTEPANLDARSTCSVCERIFSNESHMEKHMEIHGNINIVETSNVTNLSEKEGDIYVHQCVSCSEKFVSPDDFIFHKENSHKVAAVMFLG